MGYAAISQACWDLDQGKQLNLALIDYCGIHTRFRHQAGVPKEARYGRRVFGGTIEEIERRWAPPYIGLFVHPENEGAYKLYLDFGFKDIGRWRDPEDNRDWIRMPRSLTKS